MLRDADVVEVVVIVGEQRLVELDIRGDMLVQMSQIRIIRELACLHFGLSCILEILEVCNGGYAKLLLLLYEAFFRLSLFCRNRWGTSPAVHDEFGNDLEEEKRDFESLRCAGTVDRCDWH